MKTVIEMAREAGLPVNKYGMPTIATDWLERFAALVREDEREKQQDPVCWITPDGEGWRMRLEPPVNDMPLGWTPLYDKPPTAALAARQMRDAAVKVCDDVARLVTRTGNNNIAPVVSQCSAAIAALPVPEVERSEPCTDSVQSREWRDLTDDEIINITISDGILDCLCDPYDKFNTGDDYGSIQYDTQRFARAVIAKFKEKQL